VFAAGFENTGPLLLLLASLSRDEDLNRRSLLLAFRDDVKVERVVRDRPTAVVPFAKREEVEDEGISSGKCCIHESVCCEALGRGSARVTDLPLCELL